MGLVVVADEVRSLAARTQRNRQRIFKSMISALQERERNPLLQSWSKVVGKPHTSVAHAEEAATALDGIGQRVNEITDMNAQTATAVEQQGAVSEDMQTAVLSIYAMLLIPMYRPGRIICKARNLSLS
ncbi:methyl-accepting chemotaxis protein [Klebsiella pneumoniae]|nr:methyl-accepting chemotaxis protein [Klebsiella pneumoniae]